VDQKRTPATSRTGRAAGWLSLQEQDGPAEEQGPVQARLGDPERPAPQEDGAFAPGSGTARTAQRLDLRPEWLIERERWQQPARASPFIAGQQDVRRERNLQEMAEKKQEAACGQLQGRRFGALGRLEIQDP
jgi:hypothetical protein